MTPDLLQKFATNPKLAKGLGDPRFQAAIAEMQKNPKEAMLKFQKDKELSEFLQEFFSTMGDHFSKVLRQREKKRDRKRKRERERIRMRDRQQKRERQIEKEKQ